MSKIFRRPMFRGGSTNNKMSGIMSGIQDTPRTQYSNGSTKEKLLKIAAEYPSKAAYPIGQFLIQGGLNLLSGKGAGKGTLGSLAESYKEPTTNLFKSMAEKNQMEKNLALQGELLDIEQAGKEALLDKELDFKNQDLNNIDKQIEDISKDQVMKGEYSNLQEARRINNWKFKTIDSPQLSGKKIGGLLSETDLKDESKFARKLIKKNKEGYVFYDRFNNRVLEVGKDANGEPALIEIQTGKVSPKEEISNVPAQVIDVNEKEIIKTPSGIEDIFKKNVDFVPKTRQEIIDNIKKNKELRRIGTSKITKPFR